MKTLPNKWEGLDDSNFAWRKLVKEIHELEQQYRETPFHSIESELYKKLRRFFDFALPACQIWRNKTQFRHPNQRITDQLKDIVDRAEKAVSIDDMLISMEQLINAHHNTNKFGQAVAELYDGKHPLLH